MIFSIFFSETVGLLRSCRFYRHPYCPINEVFYALADPDNYGILVIFGPKMHKIAQKYAIFAGYESTEIFFLSRNTGVYRSHMTTVIQPGCLEDQKMTFVVDTP